MSGLRSGELRVFASAGTSVVVGTTTGTVAAGDDSRITGALQATNNLFDVASAASSRTNLGLGNAATKNVGTTTGTVAAGDDSRVTGAAQKSANLSDVGSTSTALANLGIDTDTTLAANSDAKFPSQKAIKAYVDAVAQGLSPKTSVAAATTAALPTNNYSGGVLTATANGALTVDGYGPSTDDRILVKNEASAGRNGIYKCTARGDASNPYVLTRTSDMDSGAEIPGAYTFVEAGVVNAGAGFVVASVGPFTIGTTAMNWTQFSGAGEITNGTGITKTGNTLAVDTAVIATVAALAAATSFATSYKWGNS